MDIFCLRDRQYSYVVLTPKFPTESKECKFPSAIFQCKYQCIFPMQISFAISNANFQCNFQCKFLMQFPMQISNANFQCKFHLQFSLHFSMQSPLHTCLQNKYTGAARQRRGRSFASSRPARSIGGVLRNTAQCCPVPDHPLPSSRTPLFSSKPPLSSAARGCPVLSSTALIKAASAVTHHQFANKGRAPTSTSYISNSSGFSIQQQCEETPTAV